MKTPVTAATTAVNSGAATPAEGVPRHHHHHHHTGRRLRQFLHPDGKKIHVAGSPEEAERLKKTLSETEEKCPFELVLHGSDEHIEILRYMHAHHESRHHRMKEEHGEVLDEIEGIVRELDALSNELHMVSDHAVQLDANFSKYGYSAHLRTIEDSSSPNSSEPSLHDSSFHKDAWSATRKLGEPLRIYQTPLVRQYFHRGLLWRARAAQEVASYELFIDLFYVGIIAITGDHAAEHPNGLSLLHFAITFTMGWKFWTDIMQLISWFDEDDVVRRVSVVFSLACLLGFTTNILDAWKHTYTPLVSFYLTARLFYALTLLFYAWKIPTVRAAMLGNAVVTIVPAALWIASIYISHPLQQIPIWFALALDVLGPIFIVQISRPAAWLTSRAPAYSRWATRTFAFIPGTNIEHRIERTGQFVTLVFGSSVLGILYQSSAEFGLNGFFGKAVLGLVQAFSMNWLYFELDGWNLHEHAIRRSVYSALTWTTIHLPLIMSYVLSASALGFLVRAHDSPNSDPSSLYKTFVPRSEAHISQGLRWFYCAGLSIALLCTAVIAYTHVHRKIPNQRLRKGTRICVRGVVAVVIMVLPVAEMESLALVGTTTALVVGVVGVEVWGATAKGRGVLWDRECKRGEGEYSARCGKVKRGEVGGCVKDGVVVDVEEIARREGDKEGLERVGTV